MLERMIVTGGPRIAPPVQREAPVTRFLRNGVFYDSERVQGTFSLTPAQIPGVPGHDFDRFELGFHLKW